jgi:hypothetical protein
VAEFVPALCGARDFSPVPEQIMFFMADKALSRASFT